MGPTGAAIENPIINPLMKKFGKILNQRVKTRNSYTIEMVFVYILCITRIPLQVLFVYTMVFVGFASNIL